MAYQIVGWYKSIKPGYRNNSTISDGVIVSNKDKAIEYAQKYMGKYQIIEVPYATQKTVDFWDEKIEQELQE
jgi:hypothetical protein